MSLWKKIVLVLALLLLAAAAWVAWQWNSRPSLERYAAEIAMEPANDYELGVTFLGVSTLLVRDQTSAVLIDGFFTRPGPMATALGRIEPDPVRINTGLRMAGIERLDAVIAAHSHYDHAMDVADVASRTGATIVGSESTANIARGRGTSESRIRVVRGTEKIRFGSIAVTLVPSEHFPHGQGMGDITAPLETPARVMEYREGGSFSIFVTSGEKTILVQASAGFVAGALAGMKADVVYLGIGLLGTKDDAYRDAYWREVVAAVGAKRVIPIHWDDFTRGLDEPLVAFPYLLDDAGEAMEFVIERAAREKVDVRWPVLGVRADPFAVVSPFGRRRP